MVGLNSTYHNALRSNQLASCFDLKKYQKHIQSPSINIIKIISLLGDILCFLVRSQFFTRSDLFIEYLHQRNRLIKLFY